MSTSNPSDKKLAPKVVSDADIEFSHWALPDVTQVPDEAVSNLFGHMGQQIEPEVVEEVVVPPTLAEIELIRAEAEAEGFSEGKTQGISQGLEQGRLEGLEQGHNEGFEQGLEQGLEAGLAEAQQLLARFEGLLSQFEKPLQLLDGEIELSLLNLTLALAKSVIGHELKTHPEQILSALRLGVESLPIKDQGVTIRLHPDDAALVEKLYSSTQLSRNRWQLDVDPSLNCGDCIISSQRSTVDLTLSARIDAVFDSLRQQQAHVSVQQQQKQEALERENAAKFTSLDHASDANEVAQDTPAETQANDPSVDEEQDATAPTPTAQ